MNGLKAVVDIAVVGIESLSRSQVSEMTKGLNEQVNAHNITSLYFFGYTMERPPWAKD